MVAIGYRPVLKELTEPLLAELVRRVRSVIDARKIVLFGSRARGDARPDSDIDLLIVADSTLPRYERGAPVYSALLGIPLEVDVDIVVYTPAEVEEWSGARRAFVTTALREGRVVYEKRP